MLGQVNPTTPCFSTPHEIPHPHQPSTPARTYHEYPLEDATPPPFSSSRQGVFHNPTSLPPNHILVGYPPYKRAVWRGGAAHPPACTFPSSSSPPASSAPPISQCTSHYACTLSFPSSPFSISSFIRPTDPLPTFASCSVAFPPRILPLHPLLQLLLFPSFQYQLTLKCLGIRD
eukprot:758066-Hanusia_phi.AAC.3